MMSVTVITAKDIGYDYADKMHQNGNIVKIFNLKGDVKAPTTGFKRIETIRNDSDLYVCMLPFGTGEIADRLLTAGFPVTGSSIKHELIVTEEKLRTTLFKTMHRTLEGPTVTVGVPLWRSKDGWLDHRFIGTTYRRMLNGDKGPIMPWTAMGGVGVCAFNDRLPKAVQERIGFLLDNMSGLFTFIIEVGKDDFSISDQWIYYLDHFGNHLFWSSCYNLQMQSEGLGVSVEDLYMNAAVPRFKVRPVSKVGIDVAVTNCSEESVDINPEALKHSWRYTPEARTVNITAWGSSLREAKRRVYRTIDAIVKTPDPIYRTDIGAGATEIMKQLEEWGWVDAITSRKFTDDNQGQRGRDAALVQEKRDDREDQTRKYAQGQEDSAGGSVRKSGQVENVKI